MSEAATGMTPPDLYDETVLRNLDLSFAQPDWWAQLRAN